MRLRIRLGRDPGDRLEHALEMVGTQPRLARKHRQQAEDQEGLAAVHAVGKRRVVVSANVRDRDLGSFVAEVQRVCWYWVWAIHSQALAKV